MQTRDQRYAAQAFTKVSNVADPDRKKYGAMAHKLPVLIRSAGLAQALAFVEARGEEAHRQLLEHLAETIGAGSRTAMLDRSRTSQLPEYMRLTQEVTAALLWYKRFAQSVLGVEPGDQEVAR